MKRRVYVNVKDRNASASLHVFAHPIYFFYFRLNVSLMITISGNTSY